MTVERIDLLVALSVKNQMHPYKNNFSAFIRQVCAAKLAISPQAALIEVKTLNTAWRADKWASIIKGNPYNITEKEVEAWETNYKLVSCTQ